MRRRTTRTTLTSVLAAATLVIALAPTVASAAYPQPVYESTFGTAGSGDGQFNYPTGIAVNQFGDIYVADYSNSRIQKFTSAGVYVTQFGTDGQDAGQLSYPTDIAFDPNGDVYVADWGNNRVVEFSSTGTFLRTFGWGVDTGADQLETCTATCQAGFVGSGDGELDKPWGIEIDSNGSIYVSDWGNDRVQKFGSDASFVTKWGGPGTGNAQFGDPAGIAFGAGGIYVTDPGNNRVQVFTTDGVFQSTFGTQGFLPGQFDYPHAIARDSDGTILVGDANERIARFTYEGTYLGDWGTSGTGPGQFEDGIFGIGVQPTGVDGQVVVGDRAGNRVHIFGRNATAITIVAPKKIAKGKKAVIKGVLSSADAGCGDTQEVALMKGTSDTELALGTTDALGAYRFTRKITRKTVVRVQFSGQQSCDGIESLTKTINIKT